MSGDLMPFGSAVLLTSAFVLWGVARRQLLHMIVIAAVMIEETFVSGLSAEEGAEVAPAWLTIGHAWWARPPGLPSLATVAAACAIAAAFLFHGRVTRPGGRGVWVALGGLAAWTFVVSLSSQGDVGAALRGSSPWILMLGGSTAARAAWRFPPDRVVVWVLLLLLGSKLTIGMLNYHATEFIPFYDAVLPMVAGVVLLAIVFRAPDIRVRTGVMLGVICFIIMVIGGRRTPLIATALIGAVMVAFSRPRIAMRVAAVGAAAVIALPTLAPSTAERLGAGVGTILGAKADESTEGHVSDWAVGLRAVAESPVLGLGPEASQLPSAANTSTDKLYLHNEYLQLWLRYGFISVGFLLYVVWVGVRRSVGILAARSSGLVHNLAAFFCIAVPISSMMFPPITSNQRWALLYGCALGVVLARPRSEARDSGARTAALRPEGE